MSWKEAHEKPELYPLVFASFKISIISGNAANKIRCNNNIIIIVIVINNKTSFVYFQQTMGLDKTSKILINLIYSNTEDKINNLFLFTVALNKNKFKMFCQYFDSHKYTKSIFTIIEPQGPKTEKNIYFVQTKVSVLFNTSLK